MTNVALFEINDIFPVYIYMQYVYIYLSIYMYMYVNILLFILCSSCATLEYHALALVVAQHGLIS